MRPSHNRIIRLLALVLVLAAISFYAVDQGRAQESGAAETDTAESKRVIQISDNEWDILNNEGGVVGRLQSDSKTSFKFYDTSGLFIGTILESGGWQHRLYRKRNTQITPEEARLYLDALRAIAGIRP